MSRVKTIKSDLGDYPYYVETLEGGEWVSYVRYYQVKQDIKDFPDNKNRRNFKYLGKDGSTL